MLFLRVRRVLTAAMVALGALPMATNGLAAQTGTITGKVTNAESGRPIENATIKASVAGGTSFGAVSGADGSFRLVLRIGGLGHEISLADKGDDLGGRPVHDIEAGGLGHQGTLGQNIRRRRSPTLKHIGRIGIMGNGILPHVMPRKGEGHDKEHAAEGHGAVIGQQTALVLTGKFLTLDGPCRPSSARCFLHFPSTHRGP